MESLQLPILAAALVVMSWAVIRLSSRTTPATSSLDVPPEVLRWQADLEQLSRELQAELEEKMAAVGTLSQAYEQASLHLGKLIQQAEKLDEEFAEDERVRLSA